MRILVTGASGQLGAFLLNQLVGGPHEVVAWSGSEVISRAGINLRPVNLQDERATLTALAEANPDAVIHAAAISSADAVARDPDRAWAVNVVATQFLTHWASRNDRRFVFTSTDLVFDGMKSWYREEDLSEPIVAYGKTKRAAEAFVLAVPRGIVARISLLYGLSCSPRAGFFDRAVAAMRDGQPRSFFSDEFRTPLDYRSVSKILARLVLSDVSGLLHLGGPERLSRFDLMRRASGALGIDSELVLPNRREDTPSAEPRPADTSLDTSRLTRLFPDIEIPGVETALTLDRERTNTDR